MFDFALSIICHPFFRSLNSSDVMNLFFPASVLFLTSTPCGRNGDKNFNNLLFLMFSVSFAWFESLVSQSILFLLTVLCLGLGKLIIASSRLT